MQGRWIRAVLLFVSITCMFALGLAMHGMVYAPNTGDVLDMLGFVGDLGNGGLYILSAVFGWGQNIVQVVTADYGTKFIVVAGLLTSFPRWMRTAFVWGESNDVHSLSLYRGAAVLTVCLGCVWYYTTLRDACHDPLRRVLLQPVCPGTIAASWVMWLIKH